MDIVNNFGRHWLLLQDRALLLSPGDHAYEGIEHDYFIGFFNSEVKPFDDIYHVTANAFPHGLMVEPPDYDFGLLYLDHWISLIKRRGELVARCEVGFNSLEWSKSVPIRKYAENLLSYIKTDQHFFDVKIDEDEYTSMLVISLAFVIPDHEVISDYVRNMDALFSSWNDKILNEEIWFLSEFDVPEEKRFVISQYLSYFGQFLVDIGIPSDCEIAVSDAKLALSVTPKDKDEAIENIHAALAAYLSLADGGDLVVTPKDDSIAMVKYQQLLANVEHMKSQLRLVEALVSVKDREIHLLEQTMEAQRLVNGKPAEMIRVEDALEPTDGVKIKKYDGAFFELDIPKLWRRLSNRD